MNKKDKDKVLEQFGNELTEELHKQIVNEWLEMKKKEWANDSSLVTSSFITNPFFINLPKDEGKGTFIPFTFIASPPKETRAPTQEEQVLQVGDFLHASCSDEIYGTISKINDNNTVNVRNVPFDLTLDVEIDELYQFDDDQTMIISNDDYNKISDLDIRVELVNVPIESFELDFELDYIHSKNRIGFIRLDTPGNNCSRCSKFFSVLRSPK